jgi:AsmA-like C-terminal region
VKGPRFSLPMGLTQRRLILWVSAVIIVLCGGILCAAYVFRPLLKNAIEGRAVATLRSEFASDVRFQAFDISFSPRMHIVARGILIGNNTARPLIQVATADAQSDLLRPWHIRTLVLEGLALRIPTYPLPAFAPPKSTWTVSIDELVAGHAHVEIQPSSSETTPLHFALNHLRVKNFNPSHAADFSAIVVSADPRADIQASGHLGPWNAQQPSLTPLQGTYTLPRCDLATLPGLKGILSSQGGFQGVLQRIEIAGDANAAQFSLSSSGRREPWHASFQAALDASDGSASIEQMNGVLQTTSFTASGVVHNVQDDGLRNIALNISVGPGRLEDIVPLAVKAKTSPVSGDLRVRGKLEILPGGQDILDRLRVDANFTAPNARFSSLDLRERLRNASRKAEGHPNEAAAGSSIASIQGQVRLDNGVAQFSDLAFDLDGASARLNGSYQLASERLDLHGEVWLDAKLSQTATGAKAFFLKAAQPFFRSKRAGSRIPIKVTGTRSDPQFALNLVK